MGDADWVCLSLMMVSAGILSIFAFLNSLIFGPAQYEVECSGAVYGLRIRCGVLQC